MERREDEVLCGLAPEERTIHDRLCEDCGSRPATVRMEELGPPVLCLGCARFAMGELELA